MVGRFLVVGVLWTLCGISSGFACTAMPSANEERFRQASAVFVGHVIRTEMARGRYFDIGDRLIVEGTYHVVEILKGDPPADHKIKSDIYGPGNCAIPVIAGRDYLVFLGVYWPGGTVVVGIDGSEAQALLNKLRTLKQ